MSWPDRNESESRPHCYGDVDIHNPNDYRCRDKCSLFRVCGVIVKNKILSANRRDESRGRDPREARQDERKDVDRGSLKAPAPEDYVERVESDLGFFGALAFNGTMSAIRAGMVEAVYATDQIPRFPYPDPFSTKKTRRIAEDDRDDE